MDIKYKGASCLGAVKFDLKIEFDSLQYTAFYWLKLLGDL